jgi:hypothetical protein
MTELNSNGRNLSQALISARLRKDTAEKEYADTPKVHVVGAGATLTAAYEQLRNAAEYTEEQVLLQRAIRRFYRRLFVLRDKKGAGASGEELITELTHAGYLQNDTVAEREIQTINRLARHYYDAYLTLGRMKSVRYEQVDKWTYELLAVEIDWLLNDASHLQAYTQFAHDYFNRTIEYEKLLGTQPEGVETALYVAIHRALLKSDDAVIRLGLLRRYQRTTGDLEAFVDINRQIDGLLQSPTTDKLYRTVDRRGAPLRVLRHMIDDNAATEELLNRKDQFLLAFEKQVGSDYESINRRVNKGIIKSVVFLVITKFIIGIAVEVPYDYLVFTTVLWTPLVINLFFPPIYMVLLRATMLLPGSANTTKLVSQIEQTLYGQQPKELSRRSRQAFSTGYNVVYAAVFIAVFGGVAFVLWRFFQFDLLHLAIFFVFLSAASFLGFRLSRMIREIESVESHQNGITFVRDFLYMPFVVVGRFLNEKYARVNVVALVLDMLIELPLKTILRLVRQWAAFISTKKDQL